MSEIHVAVKASLTAGQGLFTSRDTNPGELLFSAPRPFLAVLDTPRLSDTCSHCFKWIAKDEPDALSDVGGSPLKACGGCRAVRFCNKTCQSRAWKGYHKHECAKLAALTKDGPPIPGVVRAVMRVLWMRANGAISDADWTELCQLESHFDRFMQQVDGKEFAVNVSWTLDQVNASSNFDRALVERLYATLSVNSFTLVTPEYDPLGACLDLKVALANHSCEANAYIVMDGPQVSLRSLTTIPKDAEVFISYIDSSFSLRHRKGQLAQKYFFDCSCSKCTKGPTLREDVYLRDVNDAPRRILEAIDTEMVREWCAGSEERAKIAATHKTEAELRDFRLTVLNHRLQQNQELARREGEKRHLEDGLRLCQESRMFRFDRQPFASMVHDYMVALIGEGQLHRAFRLAVVKYFHIVPYHYPTPHHPLRVVHAWTLAQLALYVATERESEQTLAWERRGLDYGVVVFGLLKEAELNVGKSHGTSSRFAKMVQAKVEEVTTDMTRGDRAAFAAIPGKLMGQMQTLKLIGEDLKLV